MQHTHTNTHRHTQTHTHIYVYIYVYICIHLPVVSRPAMVMFTTMSLWRGGCRVGRLVRHGIIIRAVHHPSIHPSTHPSICVWIRAYTGARRDKRRGSPQVGIGKLVALRVRPAQKKLEMGWVMYLIEFPG